MFQETSQGYTTSKQQEIYLAERMAQIATELDQKCAELNEVKRIAVNLDQENTKSRSQVIVLEETRTELLTQIQKDQHFIKSLQEQIIKQDLQQTEMLSA